MNAAFLSSSLAERAASMYTLLVYTLDMPMTVTAKELRTRAAEILRAVQEGEIVTVTFRGQPVAEIKPIGRRKRPTDDAFGMWADRDDLKEPTKWVRAQRRRRADRLSSIRTS